MSLFLGSGVDCTKLQLPSHLKHQNIININISRPHKHSALQKALPSNKTQEQDI